MAIWLSSLYGKPIDHKDTDVQVGLRKLRAHERTLSKNKHKQKLEQIRQELFHIPQVPLPLGVAESDEKEKQLKKKTEVERKRPQN